MDTRPNLDHVLWLGGSPCAGKSSISRLLAEQYDLVVYHVDDSLGNHIARMDPARQPALTKWLHAACDERWMQPVEALVEVAIACYREHFALVLEDVAALPATKQLLVEGTALLPRQVAGLATPVHRTIWVVPTADFQRRHYAQRAFIHDILAECRAPEIAFDNWMARDAAFARWVTSEAMVLGYPTLLVDDSTTIASNAATIASHFGLSARG